MVDLVRAYDPHAHFQYGSWAIRRDNTHNLLRGSSINLSLSSFNNNISREVMGATPKRGGSHRVKEMARVADVMINSTNTANNSRGRVNMLRVRVSHCSRFICQ